MDIVEACEVRSATPISGVVGFRTEGEARTLPTLILAELGKQTRLRRHSSPAGGGEGGGIAIKVFMYQRFANVSSLAAGQRGEVECSRERSQEYLELKQGFGSSDWDIYKARRTALEESTRQAHPETE